MKVFKIYTGGYFYAIYSTTEEQAVIFLQEEIGYFEIEKPTEEIPESEWNVKNIMIYEDNDTSTEPYYVSIREEICGKEDQLLYSNDFSIFS